ncbi:hypothetical protein N7478_009478 [Penicillium angulare]|uniref:uncharacterized protein n=1 Tax=Penicillium angulare TaxID=116970 RepID=UPI002541FC5A|nr:uncharacterized protein N7478_009478 [Penicillium angulare]KAJ5266670.1 hypothetical protein N7478_009478 [Penicillium angulare]
MAEAETVPNTQTSPPVAEATDPASAPSQQNVKSTQVVASDKLPSTEAITKTSEYKVLDHKGEEHIFKSLYDNSESTRTLVIFIRHFFCGSCQEFIFALAKAITPSDLEKLSTKTSIIVIGCGDPGLIDFYAKETSCPFPIYADPKQKLYKELELVQNYGMGSKPEYFRKGMLGSVGSSIMQGLKHVSSGLVLKGGDSSQNGGEFLFETGSEGTGKSVTWCHRMTNTRDHSGIEEFKRVVDPEGQVLGKNE